DLVHGGVAITTAGEDIERRLQDALAPHLTAGLLVNHDDSRFPKTDRRVGRFHLIIDALMGASWQRENWLARVAWVPDNRGSLEHSSLGAMHRAPTTTPRSVGARGPNGRESDGEHGGHRRR